MTKHYETKRRRAESRSRTIVSSGLIVLCLQLAAFVRLTYWGLLGRHGNVELLCRPRQRYRRVRLLSVEPSRLFVRNLQSSLEGKYAERALHGKGFDINRYGALARRLRRSRESKRVEPGRLRRRPTTVDDLP